jgi:heme-degrading monooxygenase HmoA
MIVVTSRIRVVEGDAEALAAQYRARLHRADGASGCVGIEILRNVDRPEEFVVISRWSNREAYEAWRRGPLFREAHRRIPAGLRIDREERATDAWEPLA